MKRNTILNFYFIYFRLAFLSLHGFTLVYFLNMEHSQLLIKIQSLLAFQTAHPLRLRGQKNYIGATGHYGLRFIVRALLWIPECRLRIETSHPSRLPPVALSANAYLSAFGGWTRLSSTWMNHVILGDETRRSSIWIRRAITHRRSTLNFVGDTTAPQELWWVTQFRSY